MLPCTLDYVAVAVEGGSQLVQRQPLSAEAEAYPSVGVVAVGGLHNTIIRCFDYGILYLHALGLTQIRTPLNLIFVESLFSLLVNMHAGL